MSAPGDRHASGLALSNSVLHIGANDFRREGSFDWTFANGSRFIARDEDAAHAERSHRCKWHCSDRNGHAHLVTYCAQLAVKGCGYGLIVPFKICIKLKRIYKFHWIDADSAQLAHLLSPSGPFHTALFSLYQFMRYNVTLLFLEQYLLNVCRPSEYRFESTLTMSRHWQGYRLRVLG